MSSKTIALIALGVSFANALWTIWWSLLRSRRETRAKVAVSVSFGENETGIPTILVVNVRNGPYRETTIRHVRINRRRQKILVRPQDIVTVPSDPSMRPHEERTLSMVISATQALREVGSKKFRVAVEHDGQVDRSRKVRIAAPDAA